MNRKIQLDEISNSIFFWKFYFCWSRGYDNEKELNIDEVLEVLETDETKDYEWERSFLNEEDIEENPRYIAEDITENLNYAIEFQEYEINFFLNDIYFGNLGGHFQAWFFTLDELLAFEKYPELFLLFLPMTGIEENQRIILKPITIKYLKTIPGFEAHSDYIADCILNGLVMNSGFTNIEEIGITNKEIHSVRNVTDYERNREDVIELNEILASFKN